MFLQSDCYHHCKHKNIQGVKRKCVIQINKSRLVATLYKDEEDTVLVESGYINVIINPPSLLFLPNGEFMQTCPRSLFMKSLS